MSRIIRPGFFPPGPGLLCAYDADANTVTLPAYVAAMKPKARSRWMREHNLVPMVGGSSHYGQSVLTMMEPFQVADGTQLSNSTTETLVSNDSFLTLPANVFAYPGKLLWFRAMGNCSNVVTTPGTITMRLRYGGLAGTLLATTGAIPMRTTASTSNLWYLQVWLKALATGPTTTSLTLLAYGDSEFANNDGAAATDGLMTLPPVGTSLANVASLNGTAATALSLTAQFSVSTSPTNLTVRDAWIVAMN